jgi:hypothetical protein
MIHHFQVSACLDACVFRGDVDSPQAYINQPFGYFSNGPVAGCMQMVFSLPLELDGLPDKAAH